jgi:flagellar biosynthesis GTPase FlhF
MQGGVFFSYRREGSAFAARAIHDRVVQRLGRENVFLDVDNIDLGVDWFNVLTDRVGACDALVAVIGRNWASSTDKDDRRRLDDPDDFVRIEIEAALKRDVHVIPVLVDGAIMPKMDELPESLKGLARRQGIGVSAERFEDDVEKLTRALVAILEAHRNRDAAEAEKARRIEEQRRAQEETEANRAHEERERREAAEAAEKADAARRLAEADATRQAEEERRAKQAAEAERGPASQPLVSSADTLRPALSPARQSELQRLLSFVRLQPMILASLSAGSSGLAILMWIYYATPYQMRPVFWIYLLFCIIGTVFGVLFFEVSIRRKTFRRGLSYVLTSAIVVILWLLGILGL